MCVHINKYIYVQYLHAYKWIWDGRNSLSSWKSIFLTEFSDSTNFSKLTIKLPIFYRAHKTPTRWLAKAITSCHLLSTPTCPSRLGNTTEELVLLVRFGVAALPANRWCLAVLASSPSALGCHSAGLLCSPFSGKENVSYKEVQLLRAKCHLMESIVFHCATKIWLWRKLKKNQLHVQNQTHARAVGMTLLQPTGSSIISD